MSSPGALFIYNFRFVKLLKTFQIKIFCINCLANISLLYCVVCCPVLYVIFCFRQYCALCCTALYAILCAVLSCMLYCAVCSVVFYAVMCRMVYFRVRCAVCYNVLYAVLRYLFMLCRIIKYIMYVLPYVIWRHVTLCYVMRSNITPSAHIAEIVS